MGKYSERLNKRISTKGPDKGYCVICGQYGKLTKDHVPPKSCNNHAEMVLKTFYAGNNCQGKNFQAGIHFNTICKNCNSELLGSKYDPELVNLSKEITNLALAVNTKKIILPSDILVFLKPQKIARAVIGHLLAAHSCKEATEGIVSSPFVDALRDYFLNETKYLPEGVDIYFWVYPSRRQVIMKNWIKATQGNVDRTMLYGGILKFLPLGFWVLWEKPAHFSTDLSILVPDKNIDIDELWQMKINLTNLPPLNFPETPSDDEIILSCDEYASIGIPKRRIN